MVSNQKTIVELIKSISGQANILSIPRIYVTITGGDHRAALLLSQSVYWSDKTKRSDGYFFKSYAEWEVETGLTKSQVKRAATALQGLVDGLFKTKLVKANGAPTIHYRVDIALLSNLIITFLDNQETSLSDSDETLLSDSDETSQSLTKITQKTTTKTTKSVAPSGASPADPPTDPPSEKIKITNEIRKYAQEVFQDLTGLEPLPDKSKANKTTNSARWWAPLRTICEVGEANQDYIRALIEGAVQDLGRDKVYAPQSIINVIPKIKAKLNGRYSGGDDYEADLERRRIEARKALEAIHEATHV